MTISGGRSPLQEAPRSEQTSSPPAQPESGRAPIQVRKGLEAPSSEDASCHPARDALIVARHYGATLNGLLSAVDNFARGVEAARRANDALAQKLEGMQHLFHTAEREAESRSAELEHRVRALESKLRNQRKAFENERRFLTEDQDEFLRALLDEHEEELAKLRLERDAALQRSASSLRDTADSDVVSTLQAEVASLRAEREGSRALSRRLRAERDEARAALRSLRSQPHESLHPTTPAPPPFVAEAALHVPRAPRAPTELAGYEESCLDPRPMGADDDAPGKASRSG